MLKPLKMVLGMVLLWLFVGPAFAQTVDTAWVRRYNGPADSSDMASSIAVDDSGNVYVTGFSRGSGTSDDIATLKYYPNGDTAWVRRYNGPGNSYDYGADIVVDDSGYVYVTGYSWGSGTQSDFTTIKYHPNGDTVWIRRYNGPGNSYDQGEAIALDDSNNVYITGESYGNGTQLDYATIKYRSNGDTAWVRRYDGSNLNDVASAMAVDDSGNVYVTGRSYSSETMDDYGTIKYYPDGDTAWVRRYNGAGTPSDLATAIAMDDSNNIYVTGYSSDFETYDNYCTIKYYPDGETAWVRTYNGPANSSDDAYAIAVDNSSNIYVTGYSYGLEENDDCVTIKYYPNGDIAWVRTYTGPGEDRDAGRAIAVDSSNNVYVAGESYDSGSEYDYVTIKYVQKSSDVRDDAENRERPSKFALSQNYPNPFNPTTEIQFTVHGSQFMVHRPIHTTLKIYNVLGEMVRTLVDEEKRPGDYTIQWDGKNGKGEQLASGVYFYELKVGDYTSAKKMVLLK